MRSEGLPGAEERAAAARGARRRDGCARRRKAERGETAAGGAGFGGGLSAAMVRRSERVHVRAMWEQGDGARARSTARCVRARRKPRPEATGLGRAARVPAPFLSPGTGPGAAELLEVCGADAGAAGRGVRATHGIGRMLRCASHVLASPLLHGWIQKSLRGREEALEHRLTALGPVHRMLSVGPTRRPVKYARRRCGPGPPPAVRATDRHGVVVPRCAN